jgi:acetyl-CoA acyltransferase
MRDAVVVDVVRTPSGRGKPGGALSSVHPADLLGGALRALVERTGIDPAIVDDVICGCVSQAGEQGLNISRNALLSAGFPVSVPATTVDRQCGSGQQAVQFAATAILSGVQDVVIAGGVEMMSRVPMGSAIAGSDPLGPGVAARFPEGLITQGYSAELIAARWKLDRPALDEYSARSHQRAAATAEAGGFAGELIPVTLPDGTIVSADQTVRAGTTAEGLAGLKPSFYDPAMAERFPEINWEITAGNSSPLTDGAAAALIMGSDTAAALGLTPRAKLTHFAVAGDDPLLMLAGVLPATRKILARSGLSISDFDVYEVNEAFAPVPLMWQQEFAADPEKLNPRGGAIALGHPMGASGVRILATMLGQLEATGGRLGLQTMCEGGGLANATVVELLNQ